jgi:hypothetical protein
MNAAQRGRGLFWHRIAARAVAALVALVAGAASFEHIASVAMTAGERAWVAYSLPLAIDGLIVVGVMALVEDQRHGRHPRGVARLAVTVGVVGTLAANVASAQPTPTGWLVALAAPVCFLLSVEVLTRTGKPRTDTPAAPAAAAAGSAPVAVRPVTVPATASHTEPAPTSRVAGLAPVPAGSFTRGSR